MRLLQSAKNPKMADEAWQRGELGRTGAIIKNINEQQQADLKTAGVVADINSKNATAGYNRARTNQLSNPRNNAKFIERKDGVYSIDPTTNKAVKVADIPAEAGPAGATRYVSRADGVYGINVEHPEGFKLSGVPGNTEKPSEDIEFDNSQIQQAITDAQAEQAKIDAGLEGIPRTIEGTDIITGAKKQVENPDYTFHMRRRQQLDDDIRNWRLKLRAPKKAAATSQPASTSTKNDPLGLFQ